MSLQTPDVEGWVSYSYGRMHMQSRSWYLWLNGQIGRYVIPQSMNIKLQQALSDTGGWAQYGAGAEQVAKISEVINAAVLDFREAYGAAFDDVAKNDLSLVPISCLPYIDATVWYNLSAAYGLYTLKPDGVTRVYLTDYFEPAWKDAAVYRRAIAIARRQYREEINAIVNAEGKPCYIPRTTGSGRSL
jgi:hypothetical protein